jgi:hypothetical protein
VATVQPERFLIRRAAPLFPFLLLVSFLAGLWVTGVATGVSAALGVGLVIANFVASGASVAWSARTSPGAIYGVVLGGFFLKLVLLGVALTALRTLAWFSTGAFVATFVPSMLLLLLYEMKVLSGPVQADLWYFRDRTT